MQISQYAPVITLRLRKNRTRAILTDKSDSKMFQNCNNTFVTRYHVMRNL